MLKCESSPGATMTALKGNTAQHSDDASRAVNVDKTYHLISEQQDGLERELSVAKVEEILERRAEESMTMAL